MARRGWYPDPAGAQSDLRYWDGEGWTDGPPTPRSRAPRLVASFVGLAAVVAGATLLIPNGSGFDDVAPVPRPTGSIWAELPIDEVAAEPVALPPAQVGEGDCPVADETRTSTSREGFVVGGGLAFPVADGWTPSRDVSLALGDEQAVERSFGGASLRSTMSVGSVVRAEGFMTPEEAAWGVFHCHLDSPRFTSNNMRYDRLESGPARVDGNNGWRIRIKVSSIRAGDSGSMFDVVAVDTGGDGHGVFLAVAIEAAGQAEADVAKAIAGLTLDG